MVEKQLDRTKTHLGRSPKVCSVFGVHYCLVAACSAMQLAASRPSQLAASAGHGAHAARGALVDTSVYLKPTELLDVALDVLARLTPCLNLGVGELRHKDLLDTIGPDNCRK